ncbi:MAG: hypothetical protein ACTS4U_00825 [Candidatus Hodgkinia cicadicola]
MPYFQWRNNFPPKAFANSKKRGKIGLWEIPFERREVWESFGCESWTEWRFVNETLLLTLVWGFIRLLRKIIRQYVCGNLFFKNNISERFAVVIARERGKWGWERGKFNFR